jgi:hypothetical protein
VRAADTYTGTPCGKGHTERYSGSGSCRTCSIECSRGRNAKLKTGEVKNNARKKKGEHVISLAADFLAGKKPRAGK